MKTIKLAPGERLVTNQLNRKGVLPQNIIDAARDIVANVRANGDAAVRDYCQRFDGVELQSFRLPQEQIDAALEGLDPAFVAALEKAARQIREFHQREVEQSWFTTRVDGTMLGVKVTPLAAAGILHRAHERHSRQGRRRQARGYGDPAAKRRPDQSLHARRGKARRRGRDLYGGRRSGRGRAGVRHRDHSACR